LWLPLPVATTVPFPEFVRALDAEQVTPIGAEQAALIEPAGGLLQPLKLAAAA